MEIEEKIVRVSGGNIPYLIGGSSGSTMLFLHGGAAMPRAYLPLLTLLSKQFQVIAPTHPGHGDAFSISSAWKLADFVPAYTEFFRVVKKVPDVIVGHSLGGAVGFLLAAAGVGSQLIVMDPPGVPFDITTVDFLKAKAREARQLLSSRNKAHVRDALAAVGAVVHTMIKHPEDIPWLWQQAPGWDLTDVLRSISIPVSLLWGQKDGVVPVVVGEKMRKLMPGCELVVFPRRGHNYPILDPEFTFSEIIKRVKSSK